MKHLDIWVFSILFLLINHSGFSLGDDSTHKFGQRKVTNDDLNYPEMVSRYLKTGKLEIPHRKIRKDWYVGLHPDAVDRSQIDVRDDLHIEEATKILAETNENISESNLTASTSLENHSSKANLSEAENEKNMNANTESEGSNEIHAESNSRRLLLQDNSSKDSQEGSFVSNENVGEATVGNNDQVLVATGDPSSKLFRNSDQVAGYDYCGYYGYYGDYGGYYDYYGYYDYCAYYGYYR